MDDEDVRRPRAVDGIDAAAQTHQRIGGEVLDVADEETGLPLGGVES